MIYVHDNLTLSNSCTATNDTLGCLRTTDLALLMSANQQVILSNFLGLFTFVPVVDGEFITERPVATLAKRHINAVGRLN